MKKLLASVLIFVTVMCLFSCSAPSAVNRKAANELGCAFESKAMITLDKLNAEAVIKRFGDGEWAAEFTSPNTLSGIVMSFSEGNVTASYKGLSFSVPKSALPVKAMMLNLIEAVDTNARLEELSGEDSDGMLAVKGSLDGGEYTLTVDENGHVSAFEMPNNLLKMTFTELTVISSPERTNETIPVTETATESGVSSAVSTETTSAE